MLLDVADLKGLVRYLSVRQREGEFAQAYCFERPARVHTHPLTNEQVRGQAAQARYGYELALN